MLFRRLLRKTLLFVGVTLLILLLLFWQLSKLAPHSYHYRNSNRTKPPDFLLDTTGCRIIERLPFEADGLRQFMANRTPIECARTAPLVDSNATSIFFTGNASIMRYYARLPANRKANALATGDYTLRCCFQPLLPSRRPFGECTPFTSSATVRFEFVRVACEGVDRAPLYEDFFTFPITKARKRDRTDALNVLVLGLGSVSRLNFRRQMPETARFLHEHAAIEFLGYNTVSDDTAANLIPILTGRAPHQLTSFDSSLVTNAYKLKGYETGFGTDSKRFAPTLERHLFDRYWNHWASGGCFGSRPLFAVLLTYVRHFVAKMTEDNLPYFGFFWSSSLTRADFNGAQLADGAYAELLHFLHRNDFLNRTILVVLSEAGFWWENRLETPQGWLEARLPLLTILLPKWYESEYEHIAQNIRTNSQRLTTPFDVFATLESMAEPFEIPAAQRTPFPPIRYSFLRPIPTYRSCASAGIKGEWCTCQGGLSLDNDKANVIESAEFVVREINRKLMHFWQCAKWFFVNVINVERLTFMELRKRKWFKFYDDIPFVDYKIRIRTSPNAVFEATVRHTRFEKDDSYLLDVIGSIVRLTPHNSHSYCVNDPRIKLYCYCNR